MKQGISGKKKSEASIKRIVSEQFFRTVEHAIDNGLAKNQRDFAIRIQEEQAEFSKIKSADSNRYVDIEMLYKAVNILGLNANHILVEDGDKTEKLQRDGVTINGGTAHGNNNIIMTGQAVSNSGDVYYNVEKLIQGLPSKDKKTILEKIGKLEIQNTGLNSQIEDLKKTIDRYEREIEKDRKIIESQDKLIKMMESASKKK